MQEIVGSNPTVTTGLRTWSNTIHLRAMNRANMGVTGIDFVRCSCDHAADDRLRSNTINNDYNIVAEAEGILADAELALA
jgi:hypothetical protein